jgi:hypothetical protein
MNEVCSAPACPGIFCEIGWTCPACGFFCLQEWLVCPACDYVRTADFPMDGESQ